MANNKLDTMGIKDKTNGSTDNSTGCQTADRSSNFYKILIVDDEQDITLMYRTVLEEAGFNVDTYNDPMAALSKVKEAYSPSLLNMQQAPLAAEAATKTTTTKPYDLLLLDIKMPKINGFELYREIKKVLQKDEQSNNVKVCFITAYEVYYEQLKEEFPKINIACFIKKPITGASLIKRIKQELDLQ